MRDGLGLSIGPYPAKFPISVDLVLGWDIPEESRRRLMSENAERYLRLL